jgi:glycine/D-amino acid oxidase-like deaminating enzyme
MPTYQRLSADSVDSWRAFGDELEGATGADLQYENDGGLVICLGEAELEARRSLLTRLHNQLGGEKRWEMIDRASLAALLPGVRLGHEVTGASFGRGDGHCNPLRLLAALHDGILKYGGQLMGGCSVHTLRSDGQGNFTVGFGDRYIHASRVVVAAGLGSKPLAAQVDLDVPIFPERGQLLVTERLAPFLPLPMSGLRQTREGTVMIGATQDGEEFDTSTTTTSGAALAARAIRRIPALSEVKLVRQWAGLRIMTPDGHPIYAESESHPGAFVAICHSGITLAAIHSTRLACDLLAGKLSPYFDSFHHRRFDVPQAA